MLQTLRDLLAELSKDTSHGFTKTAARTSTPVSAPDAPTGAPASARFMPAAERFVTRQRNRERWDEKTCKQALAEYRLFSKVLEEELGVTTFAELRQQHLEHYDNFLLAIYKFYGRSSSDAERSIAELREIASLKPADQCGLDIVTRSRHMSHLSALLSDMRTTEELDPKLNTSAFTGKKKTRARNDRAVPRTSSMVDFFNAPVFTGCSKYERPDEPGEYVFHRAAYFGPMLAHYQGMRREEFCGLSVDDVVIDNGAFPYLHVGFNEFRRLKNHQSIRNLALHPELVRLGFLDYVQSLRDLGYQRVFPDLHSPTSKSLLGDRLYKELEPIRKRLGISPHQFRHFFNNELKQNRVSEEFRQDMMGHGGKSETSERYCDPISIELQLEDLGKIAVRTAHLDRQPITVIPWVAAKMPFPKSRPNQSKRAHSTR